MYFCDHLHKEFKEKLKQKMYQEDAADDKIMSLG